MGEFNSTLAIHTIIPDFCPKPMGWGTFQNDPNSHFYICKFYDFVEGVPEPSSFCESFADGLRHSLKIREERAGKSPELDALLPQLFDTVIPRLLRPLESGGRKIKPSLVHGDLWYGNAGIIDGDTEKGIVYDPASFWAHNECT